MVIVAVAKCQRAVARARVFMETPLRRCASEHGHVVALVGAVGMVGFWMGAMVFNWVVCVAGLVIFSASLWFARYAGGTIRARGYANDGDRLERVEAKVDSMVRGQGYGAGYHIAVTFVVLGLALWPGFLRTVGLSETEFYEVIPPFVISVGFVIAAFTYLVGRVERP